MPTVSDRNPQGWTKLWKNYGALLLLIALLIGLTIATVSEHFRGKKPEIVFVKTNEVMARYRVAIQAREAFQKDTAAMAEEARQLDLQLREKAKGADLKKPKVREDLAQMKSRLDTLRTKGAQRDRELMTPVIAEVNSGIKRFAQKHGYKLVVGTLDGGVVLYGDESLDVTEALIADLNR